MTYRMIVTTETVDRKGRPLSNTETIRNVPESQVSERRAAARLSAPKGSTRLIKVLAES